MFSLSPVLMVIIVVLGILCVYAFREIERITLDMQSTMNIYMDAEEHLMHLMSENKKLKDRIKEIDPDYKDEYE